MQGRRLLERIMMSESLQARARISEVEALTQSILQHLQRILNTRQGTVLIDPEFGVPDFTNLAGSFVTGETSQMIDNITRMVARYEPRLKSPCIVMAQNADEVLSLSFSLQGLVSVNDRDIPLHLATRVSSDGRVSLSMR